MGRIKTKRMKAIGERLFSKHTDLFTPEFDKNKHVVESVIHVHSKKIRNIVAGYITRRVKQSR